MSNTKDAIITLEQRMTSEAFTAALEQALPKHIRPGYMVRTALTVVQRSPQLRQATGSSILGAVLESSMAMLPPDGVHSAIVPFRNSQLSKQAGRSVYEAQWMPMYKGLVQLMYRSGQVKAISANKVYEKDEFEYWYGLEEHLKHVPVEEQLRDSSSLTHVYAVCRTTLGGVIFKVLDRARIEYHRKHSRAQNGPWQTHYEEMAQKSALKELAPLSPFSLEVQRAVAMDDLQDMGKAQNLKANLPPDMEVGLEEDLPEMDPDDRGDMETPNET